MPYQPGIQYRGDQYLFQGISRAGEGLAQAVSNFRKDRDESQFLVAQVGGLAAAAKPLIDSGDLDPKVADELSKFPAMSLSKKRGTAASVAFQIQHAGQVRKEKAETEDRGLRREIDLGRLRVEAERFNQGAREVATERGQREGFNAGLAEYLAIPETIRRPDRNAVLGIAARSGVATPEMAARMDDARLRESEMDIRNRAVAVQERQVGVSEQKAETPPARKLSAAEIKDLIQLKNTRDQIQRTLATAQSQVDAGNKRSGPDWGWGEKYEDTVATQQDQLESVTRRIAEIEGGPEAKAPAAAAGQAAAPPVAAPAAPVDAELQAAIRAIQQGADPVKVDQRYRQRTGKALPW